LIVTFRQHCCSLKLNEAAMGGSPITAKRN
jgi:hypothetical protein